MMQNLWFSNNHLCQYSVSEVQEEMKLSLISNFLYQRGLVYHRRSMQTDNSIRQGFVAGSGNT